MAKNTPAVVGRGPFDQILIDGFSGNASAEEVSELTGGVLTPVQCLARVTKLIRSRDVLDAADRLNLLLDDVYWLRNKLKEQMEKSGYIDEKQAGIYLKTIESLVKRIETVNAGLGEAMLRFNELRATEFVEALTIIIDRLFSLLEEKHPEYEITDMSTIVLEAIPESIPRVS